MLVVHNQFDTQKDLNSVRYHPHILKCSQFTEIVTQKIIMFLNSQVSDNDGHFLDLTGLDVPARYEGLEGGVASLLNPLITIMREAHAETHKNFKKTQLQFESKYQKHFFIIEKKLRKNPKNDALMRQLNALREERNEELSKSRVAARQLYENMVAANHNSSSRFSFRPFRARNSDKKIKLLIVDDVHYTNDQDIARIMSEFHKKKTTEIQEDDGTYFFDKIQQQLNIPINEIFEQLHIPEFTCYSKKQVSDTINDFKNISAPGPSGQTKQFYSTLFKLIPNLFTEIVNNIMHALQSPTQELEWIKKRRIIFILKKGKIPTNPESYRPISLLEVFYKILAKLLSKQLNSYLTKLVHPDQFGFVPGRQMSVASLTLRNLINSCKSPQSDVFAIFLDIAAAFDSVRHKALYQLLEYIFPESDFSNLIKNLATGGVACVFVNGCEGELFILSKGTGQGDPLSSPKYVIIHHLVIRVLHLALLRRTNMITCLPETLKEITPQCFADDTSLLLRILSQYDIDQWNFIWEVLTDTTGLRLNPSKTQMLQLGEQCRTDLAPQIGVLSDHVTHLGVVQAVDDWRGSELTYANLVEKTKKSISLLLNASSSTDLLHKSMLVRSLINSQLLHIFRVYPPSTIQLKELDNLIRKAMWAKKFQGTEYGRVKVSKKRVHAPLSRGGINLALPSDSAMHAFFGSLVSVIQHGLDQEDSMINTKFNFVNARAERVRHWGSRSIHLDFPWLLELIPLSGDYLRSLEGLLERMESEPRLAHHASLWGSCHSNFSALTIDQFTDAYPEMQSINDIVVPLQRTKRTPVELKPGLQQLAQIDNGFLNSVISSVKNKIKEFPKLKREGRISRSLTLFPYLISYHPSLLKEFHKKITVESFPEIPPSYSTRLAEGIDAPRDPLNFSNAFTFLKKARIESRLKSFQFEVLSRTLPSVRKLNKFQFLPSALCLKCPGSVIASSAHIIADCTIPTYFIKIFNSFASVHVKFAGFKLDTVNFEFGFHQIKLITKDTNEQMQHIFMAVKKVSLESHLDPRFPRWTNLVYYAKILSCVKRILLIRRFAHLNHDIIQQFLDFLIDNYTTIQFI